MRSTHHMATREPRLWIDRLQARATNLFQGCTRLGNGFGSETPKSTPDKEIYQVSMHRYLEYEVKPGTNVPQGLPRQRLPVLSPIWRGSALALEYPDGEVRTLVGWSGSAPGESCGLKVFWTRHEPAAPAVALAIGGDAGLRHFGSGDAEELAPGLPFRALAPSMIPSAVLEVIGPAPESEPAPPLLLT